MEFDWTLEIIIDNYLMEGPLKEYPFHRNQLTRFGKSIDYPPCGFEGKRKSLTIQIIRPGSIL